MKPPTTAIYTLSLHDALPICLVDEGHALLEGLAPLVHRAEAGLDGAAIRLDGPAHLGAELGEMVEARLHLRSEEHTSELQSHSDLVCRLLLEKKNKKSERMSP